MKTNIFILVLAAALFYPFEQKAQSFTTGIIAGVSTTSVNFSDIKNSFTNTIKGNNITGFEGGLFERMNLGPIFIKPMLLLSYQGGTITYYNNDGSFNSSKFNYGKLEVPLLVGLRFFGLLRIEGGPVYNWIYTARYDRNDAIKIASSGLGYRIGTNIELGIVNLGLAYQGITNKSPNSSATFTTPNELIFSAALCFGGKSKNK